MSEVGYVGQQGLIDFMFQGMGMLGIAPYFVVVFARCRLPIWFVVSGIDCKGTGGSTW